MWRRAWVRSSVDWTNSRAACHRTTTKAQVHDLGLLHGADDGKRTRALSLGITEAFSGYMLVRRPMHRPAPRIHVPSTGRGCPRRTARPGAEVARGVSVRAAAVWARPSARSSTWRPSRPAPRQHAKYVLIFRAACVYLTRAPHRPSRELRNLSAARWRSGLRSVSLGSSSSICWAISGKSAQVAGFLRITADSRSSS